MQDQGAKRSFARHAVLLVVDLGTGAKGDALSAPRSSGLGSGLRCRCAAAQYPWMAGTSGLCTHSPPYGAYPLWPPSAPARGNVRVCETLAAAPRSSAECPLHDQETTGTLGGAPLIRSPLRPLVLSLVPLQRSSRATWSWVLLLLLIRPCGRALASRLARHPDDA